MPNSRLVTFENSSHVPHMKKKNLFRGIERVFNKLQRIKILKYSIFLLIKI